MKNSARASNMLALFPFKVYKFGKLRYIVTKKSPKFVFLIHLPVIYIFSYLIEQSKHIYYCDDISINLFHYMTEQFRCKVAFNISTIIKLYVKV